MAENPRVVAGQVWESRDGRQRHVERVDGPGDDWASFAYVRGERGTRIRVQTLWDRYRLVGVEQRRRRDGAHVPATTEGQETQ